MGKWCGDLIEDGSHRLRYFNICFPFIEIFWKGLGGVALLESVIP